MALTDSTLWLECRTIAKVPNNLGQILGYVWICVLASSLLFAGYHSYQVARHMKEYAYACDPFGYLVEARAIRLAARDLQWPQFPLQSPQSELLINHMRSSNLPVSSWRLMVAPHASLYFPKSHSIAVQYPPGTGLILSAFPEGKAFVRLNKTVIYLFVTTGLILLATAARKRAWASAGCVIVPLCMVLKIIDRMDALSFSINAILPVLLITLLLLCVEFTRWAKYESAYKLWARLFLLGTLMGLIVLIRLPALLLAPGLLFLLWNPGKIGNLAHRLVPLALGGAIAGVIPLFAFQHQETGSWYVPTYAPEINSAPTSAVLKTNLSYYLGSGLGGSDNWALVVILIGCAAIFIHRHRTKPVASATDSKRLIVAGLLLWIPAAAYFLTHTLTTPYYLIPSTFACIGLLAFGTLITEGPAEQPATGDVVLSKPRLTVLVLALTFLPGLVAITECWNPLFRPDPQFARHRFNFPPDLLDSRAWIWTDFLSGSFWYYGHKPAYRIDFSDQVARLEAYRFAFERGEPQYLVRDSPFLTAIMDEISRFGGTFEPIPGTVDGAPYYLIHWPKNGPVSVGESATAR